MLEDEGLPIPQPPRFARFATALLAGCSGAMLAFAVPAMVGSEGVLDLIKSAVIAAGATITSYAVTRLAVEKGAPQAVIGMKGSAVVSILSILTVGAGLFASTYAGFTLRETEALRLGDFGRELAAYVDARGRSAQEAGRSAPVLRSIVDDLGMKEDCERRSSCLSGRESGGTGPVARTLGEKRQRAEAILGQVIEGESVRTSAVAQLGALLERYQAALIDPEASQTERRKALQAVAGEVGAQLNILDEAVPTALLHAYALELRTPVSIPEQRDVSAKLSGLLQSYANSLGSSLRGFEPGATLRPVFPARTGVIDTFFHVGHFIPIAAVVAVVELIFPITLWLYTLFALKAGMARPDDGMDGLEPGSLSGLAAIKAVDEPPLPRRRHAVRSE